MENKPECSIKPFPRNVGFDEVHFACHIGPLWMIFKKEANWGHSVLPTQPIVKYENTGAHIGISVMTREYISIWLGNVPQPITLRRKL